MTNAGRTVHALVSQGERWLGAMSPFHLESPWWPDVEPVNLHLKQVLGVDTYVLRLVSATGSAPRDGDVTYHIEMADDPSRPQPWTPIDPSLADLLLAPQALRRPWAKPGGPAADLEWADDVLNGVDRPRTGPAVQVKTWNLSCVQRLPTADGNVWLKTTGLEQTREELPMAAVARHDATLVAPVIEADPSHGRILCEELPGRDLVGASLEIVLGAVDRWIAVQAAVAMHGIDRLVDAGIRHRPLGILARRVAALLDHPSTAALSSAERRQLANVVQSLPGRVDRITATGLPETLVHGDFTPINWRGSESGIAIMDWSDACIGHPAGDLIPLLARVPVSWHRQVTEAWCDAWATYGPPNDPVAATSLIPAVAHLQMALVYADFLDAIEPSERCYHEDDPVAQLRLAIETWDLV